MEKPFKFQNIESKKEKDIGAKKERERGVNVTLYIHLIRHPEKDPLTGKLTEKGKKIFLDNLIKEFRTGYKFDTIKFYVSPLPRGQESKEPILKFLEITKIPTKIRTKKELAGRALETNASFKKEMNKILERLFSPEKIEEAKKRDEFIPNYEPANQDIEIITNEIIIRDYYNKPLPGQSFTGRQMGEPIKNLIEHFSEMAKRLRSNSKVKLVLVSHSGIIEHFVKFVYLQNHPELKPEDVDVQKIGGIVNFGEGPLININLDEKGRQIIKMKFKNLKLSYKYE